MRALARWLFFGHRGEFRSGDYEEIINKASCLSLLCNAVLVWNTTAIMKIVTQLWAASESVSDPRTGADLTVDVPARHPQRNVSFRPF